VYSVDDKDSIVPITEIPKPDAGAPTPAISASEFCVAVAYYAAGSQDAVALVTFDSYAHMFGPPNDEALDGHPLYSRGLDFYMAFEVQQSSWIRSLERMNRVHVRHDPAPFVGYRHFIITFHDSTFECVANGFRVSMHAADPAEVLRSARR